MAFFMNNAVVQSIVIQRDHNKLHECEMELRNYNINI